MSSAIRVTSKLAIAAVVLCVSGCDEDKSTSAPAKPSATPPLPTAPAPAPMASALPVASAEPETQHDCPEGAKGPGSFNKPCEATGTARLMEVTWTWKMGDAGPSFRVVNKSKLDILYGKVVVYFYDKAGKQLEANDLSETPAKKKPKPPGSGERRND